MPIRKAAGARTNITRNMMSAAAAGFEDVEVAGKREPAEQEHGRRAEKERKAERRARC